MTLEIYLKDHSEELRAEARAEGKAEGISEGNVKGKRAEKKTIALKLNSMGMPDITIADAVDAPLNDVKKWILESSHLCVDDREKN